MAATHPVRIPRRSSHPGTNAPRQEGDASFQKVPIGSDRERRENLAGTQRVVRLTVLYLFALVAMYVGFLVYSRTAPGGGGSSDLSGLLLLSAIFVLFAVVGGLYTLSPAPRSVEVAGDRVIVVGRWGRRRRLPPIDRLTVRVARRYSAGWLSNDEVELIEVWGDDTPVQSYIAGAGLFAGAAPSSRSR